MPSAVTDIRADGRAAEEWRPAFLKTGTVSRADGSAYVEFGGTKVIVSVFGPREDVKAKEYSAVGKLKCHVSKASFSTASPELREASSQEGKWGKGSIFGGEEEEAEGLSSELLKALLPSVQLKTFPKTRVDVYGLILQSAGSDLSVLTMASSLALADAGVSLFDLVSSATVSVRRGALLLDPVSAEERDGDAQMTLALMAGLQEVSSLRSHGTLLPTLASEALELCLSGCGKMDAIMRTSLREEAVGADENDQGDEDEMAT